MSGGIGFSAGQHSEPALAFLMDASASHRCRPRRDAEALRLWFRLAMACALFLAGLLLGPAHPSFGLVPGLGDIALGWHVLAAAVGTAVASKTGGGRAGTEGRATVPLAAASAGLSGAAVLICAGASWRAGAIWAGAEMAVCLALLTGLRLTYAQALASLSREGGLAKRVAVVGSGPAAQRAMAALARSDGTTLQFAGRYAADGAEVGEGQRGDLRTLLCDARLDRIDAIVVALEPAETARFEAIRRALRACVQDVFAPRETLGSRGEGVPVTLGGAEFVTVSQQPISVASLAAKRAFDVVVACAFLALMAPLLGPIAVAIRLETRGPVLFRQLRVGYNNRLFYVLKFRSMHWNASDRLAKQQTVRGDTRVTRVGRIIRRLSLDELPQLLNVVRGEMSLVGPRPHAPGTSIGGQRIHTLVEDYARRHLVRPGITGLAQVRGLRGGLVDRRQVAERISSDLEYIERWSLWLDVRILLGTVLQELRDSRGV